MNLIFAILGIMLFVLHSCSNNQPSTTNNRLFYYQPAKTWNEALPIGNGRLGAMIFGGVTNERIQFNEETLWQGEPHGYEHPGAVDYLDDIRQLLFDGKQKEAHDLAMEHFMSVPLRQMAYQPFGDLNLEFPDQTVYSNYQRELNLNTAVCRTSYTVNGVNYTREVLASQPDQAIVIHLTADRKKALSFHIQLDSPHEQKEVSINGNKQIMKVAVKEALEP